MFSLLRDGQEGRASAARSAGADPAAVLLESIHRFKGLERPVVVLVELEGHVKQEKEEILYVGLTRARAHLVVVGSEATLEAVGLRRTELPG